MHHRKLGLFRFHISEGLQHNWPGFHYNIRQIDDENFSMFYISDIFVVKISSNQVARFWSESWPLLKMGERLGYIRSIHTLLHLCSLGRGSNGHPPVLCDIFITSKHQTLMIKVHKRCCLRDHMGKGFVG